MHALTLGNLRKTYPSGVMALDGIDLTVDDGDFFALLGPNGAGKSTAIGIISSLIRKSSGQVAVFGRDLDHDPAGVKSAIGLVPQEFNFNQFEPIEEICANQGGYYGMARRPALQRAEECLKLLELWDRRRSIPRELSGGMKRRLMIARALVHRPRLLILDEPTAGVDIEIRRSMWELLAEINRQGTTIILTTHYLEEAESLCRHIAIINQGRILEHSRLDTLLHKLDSESFLFSLRATPTALPEIPGCELTLVEPTLLEATISKKCGIGTLFAAFGTAGVEVVSLRNKQNRLEKLFIDLLETSRNGPAP